MQYTDKSTLEISFMPVLKILYSNPATAVTKFTVYDASGKGFANLSQLNSLSKTNIFV